MKLSVKVSREGGEDIVKVSPLAFIGWERITGRKMSDLANGGLGMLDLATLAMEQERLQGAEVPDSVDAYLADVAELDPVTEDPPHGGEATSDGP